MLTPPQSDLAGVHMPIGSDVCFGNERFIMGRHFENAAERNHRQSLARLAERGGLEWSEAAAIIEMRPWFNMDQTAAEQIVRAALSAQSRTEGGTRT
ncbi:hypothetical protein [Sphingomonas sp. PB4P5]|uniref:hypothetical protein n=1 Tax=Parasphingomonas puruogangriensis TaxID=3096155 RepID=UPI002FC64BE5